MPHITFILAAYLITAAVLLWAALAPILSKHSLVRQLRATQKHKDERP